MLARPTGAAEAGLKPTFGTCAVQGLQLGVAQGSMALCLAAALALVCGQHIGLQVLDQARALVQHRFESTIRTAR